MASQSLLPLLQEVAEAYGLSRERIRQIEDKALKVGGLSVGCYVLCLVAGLAQIHTAPHGCWL